MVIKEGAYLLGDCIKGMRGLPDNSIDLVIADPPYNCSVSGGTLKTRSWKQTSEKWDKFSMPAYMELTCQWLKEAKRVLKPTGSLWVFGTYHNLGIVNIVRELLGFYILNDVIWYKRNAMPNLMRRRLTASHETIYWMCKDKKNYYFDYEWSKNSYFLYDSMKYRDKQMRSVWDIPINKELYETQFGRHPTQKPVRLIDRIVRLASKPDDIVLVPFAGVASECLASALAGRKFIGYELRDDYYTIGCKRLEAAFVSDDTGACKE